MRDEVTITINSAGYAELKNVNSLPESSSENTRFIQKIIDTNSKLQTQYGLIKYLVEYKIGDEIIKEGLERIVKYVQLIDIDKVAFYGLSKHNIDYCYSEISMSITFRKKVGFFGNRQEALDWLLLSTPLET